ncbi:sulfatase [Bengtsoniella intestinalis]|uniref:sulfatase family protein n=1 Tax=Bengtsoniella intestinalis TaxID=3073143 RepID=UPI00391F8A1A
MKQPNVILIYPDQLRFDALSCNGNTVSHTPRMDELAQEGTNFQRSYSSYPLCCPFRASLMTGLYPHKNGMYSNHYPLATDLPHYLPKIMGDNGYKTAWIGKWHLNGGKKFEAVPKEYWCGFDELIGYGRGHHYIDSLYYRNEDPTPYKSEKFEPVYQTEHLMDFVDRSLAEEKPFMGMICYGLPHPPVEMQPEDYKTMFSADDITLPVTVPPHHQKKAKEYIAMYYGMVKCVDEQIGRLIDHLKEKGIYDDTVFIVLSDHGDMCGEFGMYEKSIFYDASAHTPMLIRYPAKVKSGSRPTQMVDSLIDVTPTILDLCDIAVPETMDGMSMGAILKEGQDETFRDYTYYEILRVPEELCDVMDKPDRKNYAERGFRTADTVYVERANVPFAYYDLTTDPLEQYNCIDNFKFYPQIKECRAKLSDMMAQYHDDWSLQRDQLPPDFQTQKEAIADYDNAYQKAQYEI